ncbi:MAG: AI-2E family transporter, partial [Bacteroidota bacterium]
NIGSIISTLIPSLLFLLQTRDIAQVTLLTAILTVAHNVIGNTIEPKVMGDRLDLSPVVVLFSLIFWGWMWGIVGMVLSIPIMAVTKALLGSVDSTRPLAILMGAGEPPAVDLQEPAAS